MSKNARTEKPVKKRKNNLPMSEQQEVKTESNTDMVYKIVGNLASSKNDNKVFGKIIYNQLKNSCRDYDPSEKETYNTLMKIFTELEGIKPKDQIEGMLATQMIATHHATMDCFRIAAQNGRLDVINPMLGYAGKLSRTFTMQIEALNRYRGKGQQKMTVEHVHVNSGGQAIIGNVTKNNPSLEEREGVKK